MSGLGLCLEMYGNAAGCLRFRDCSLGLRVRSQAEARRAGDLQGAKPSGSKQFGL